MRMTVSGGILLQTELPGAALHARGKVRDIYAAGEDLLFVATDRISAFDYVLPTGIPDKGRALTQLSLFWFDFLRELVPNHVITADVDRYPEPFRGHREQLDGRSMLVRRARMFPVECVVRGYLAGSAWKEYQESGGVSGVKLPPGLTQAARLPQPIFTPATKAESGHDENISFDEMSARVGATDAERLRDLSLAIYQRAAAYAEERGIIIADTKFEFGRVGVELVLADEVLTPDSSRFWPSAEYRIGISPPSFDKQFVRDYLEEIRWDKRPPAPALPPEVAHRTAEKYREALRRLAGTEALRFSRWS